MKSGNADEEPLAGQRARCWWANHGKDFRPEIEGGYLWCAKGGRGSVVLDNMARAAPGEVVFSFAEGRVGAVGVVSERQRAAPAPGARPTSARRAPGGWLLPVRFAVLGQPLVPGEHMERLGPVLPAKHAPLRAAGARSPGPYLAEVPPRMAAVLEELLGGQLQRIEEAIAIETDGQLADAAVEEQIWRRGDLALRDKRQLIAARRGQGVFRLNVESIEKLCRVTGVPDRRHLRASHIKPCTDCASDAERLDVYNDLLLAPHLDAAFDRGFITVSDDGVVIVPSELDDDECRVLGLDESLRVRGLAEGPRTYLL